MPTPYSESMKDFTRGGQTTLHNLRMVMQIIRKILLVFLIIFISFNTYWWYFAFTHYSYPISVAWTGISSEIRLALGHDKDKIEFEAPDGVTYQALPADVIHSQIVLSYWQQLKDYGEKGLYWAALISFLSCALITYFLWSVGKRQRNSKRIRGITLVTNRKLTRELSKRKKKSDITLAGVPLVKDSENAHFLIAGTPGTGKSVCMGEFLDFIRTKSQRAIVYDRVGDFVSNYYRPEKDILLNPLDERCPPWQIWRECRDASDYDTLAAALMPLPPSSYDPFWINAARTIFAATAFQLSKYPERKMSTLLNYLLTADLDSLGELLKGTEAETLVSEKIEKTALSVKTVLATYLKSMKYLQDDEKAFSIREWIKTGQQDSWLFVTSRADKHESLKPLISAWLEIAGSSLMSLSPDKHRRVWLCIDELPSLHRLPYLATLLAESRKFGGSLIATVQSIAQLRDIYGPHATEAISGLCNTRIFFRSPEPQTADWLSKSLGECEWDEAREGFSYGANTLRDGVSMNRQRIIRPVVMPSEIMQLPDLHAYLKLPGDWPITQLKFQYKNRLTHALGFSERAKEADTLSEFKKVSKDELSSQKVSLPKPITVPAIKTVETTTTEENPTASSPSVSEKNSVMTSTTTGPVHQVSYTDVLKEE